MKSLLCTACLLLVTLLTQNSYAAKLVEIEGKPPEKTIEVADDSLILITPKAIAGSTFELEVNGDAEAKLYTIKKIGGDPPLLGPSGQRIVVTPPEKGKFALKVTIAHPTLAKPLTDVYVFEVQE